MTKTVGRMMVDDKAIQANQENKVVTTGPVSAFTTGGLFDPDFVKAFMPWSLSRDSRIRSKMKSDGIWYQLPEGTATKTRGNTFVLMMSFAANIAAIDSFLSACIRNHKDFPRRVHNIIRKEAKRAVEEHRVEAKEVTSDSDAFVRLLLANDEYAWAGRLLIARAFFLRDNTLRVQATALFDDYSRLENYFGGRPMWVDDPKTTEGALLGDSVLPHLELDNDDKELDGEEADEIASSQDPEFLSVDSSKEALTPASDIAERDGRQQILEGSREMQLVHLASEFGLAEDEEIRLELLTEIENETERQRQRIKAVQKERASLIEDQRLALKQKAYELRDHALTFLKRTVREVSDDFIADWTASALVTVAKMDATTLDSIQRRLDAAFIAVSSQNRELDEAEREARKLVVSLDANALRMAANVIEQAKVVAAERFRAIMNGCLVADKTGEAILTSTVAGHLAELGGTDTQPLMHVTTEPESEPPDEPGSRGRIVLAQGGDATEQNTVGDEIGQSTITKTVLKSFDTEPLEKTIASLPLTKKQEPNSQEPKKLISGAPHVPLEKEPERQSPALSSRAPVATQAKLDEQERRTAGILVDCLKRCDLGAAFQLQRARQERYPQQEDEPDIDARLLWVHAVVASLEWHQAEAELSRTVDEAVIHLSQKPIKDAATRKAQALFAGVGCIASALSTGNVTAATVYQQSNGLTTESLPEINSILYMLTVDRGVSYSVNSSSLQVLSAGEFAGGKADEISQTLCDVIRNPRKNGDKPTDIVIGRWVNGGMLDRLGRAMGRGNSTDIGYVQDFLAQFYTTVHGGIGLNEDAIYQKLLEDGADIGKGGKLKVQNWAVRAMNKYFGRLCNLALQWERAKRLEAETERQATNNVRKLIKQVSAEMLNLRETLTELVDSDTAVISGAATVALATTEHLIDLIAPTESSQPEKRPFKHVIGGSAAAWFGIHLNRNFLGVDATDSVIENFLARNTKPHVDPAKLEEHLERGNFLSAELTLDVLKAAGHQIDLNEYAKRLKRALSVKRKELSQTLNKLSDEADIAAGKGILSDRGESQLEHFRRIVGSIDPFSLPTSFNTDIVYPEQDPALPDDLGAAIYYVGRERSRIEGEKRRRGKSIEQRLNELVEREKILPAVETQVRNALVRGNYSAAQEFLNTPDVPPVQTDREDAVYLSEYNALLPDIIDLIGTKATMETTAHDAAEFIATTTGGGFADDITDEQAAEIISLWRRLGVGDARVSKASVKRILGFLGFTAEKVDVAPRMRASQVDRYTIETLPVNDRSVIPVYRFGSEAGGRYVICVANVGCSWQTVCKEFGAATSETIIVLYKGVLRESVKTSIREAVYRHSPALVVFDQGMLLYAMTKQRSERLSAIFHLALPYAVVNPYRAVEGVALNEMFVGRQSQMRAIIDPDDANFLYGGRQLGKTALLMQAEATHHNPVKGMFVVTVLLDRGLGVPEHLWERIGEALTKHCIVNNATKSEVIRKRVRSFLHENETHRLILLIDEADAFLEQDIRSPGKNRKPFTELDRVKRLMSSTNNRFKVVFCGLNNVMRHDEAVRDNSPLLHMQQGVLIGPFEGMGERLEAIRFVQQPLNAIGYVFEDTDLPYQIIAEMNFYPSLIMLFCNELVKHLNEKPLTTFPVTITGEDVETVQARETFRRAQEKRFFGTLALDDRYELLCRIIVENIFEQKNSNRLDAWMDVPDIAVAAEFWWQEAFPSDMDADVTVEALLEEMLQLGVLRKLSGKGRRYTLRSINLLMLFKDKTANTTKLEKIGKRSPPQSAVEPSQYRIPGDASDRRASLTRSTLTYANFMKILREDNIGKPVVVFGSALSDLNTIPSWMRIYRRQIDITVIDGATSESDLRKEIASLPAPAKSEDRLTRIVFVAPTVPWTLSWFGHIRRMLEELRVRLVMLGDLGDAQVMLREIREHESQDAAIDIIEASPWTRCFVRQWVQENAVDCLHDEEVLDKLEQATAFLPGLMNRMARLQAENSSELSSLIKEERYGDLVSDEMEVELRSLSFEHRAILRALADYSSLAGTNIDEIVEVADECAAIDKDDAYDAAESLKASGYIVAAGPHGSYGAPSVISIILST